MKGAMAMETNCGKGNWQQEGGRGWWLCIKGEEGKGEAKETPMGK
jgi:hypothetical protein